MFLRFDYERISSVMGDSSRTTYLTMIRDPVDIFVSAWHYYKLGERYKLTLGMQYAFYALQTFFFV